MKDFSLSNNWKLQAHEKCTLFTDNNDRFILLDWDLDTVLILTTTENSLDIENCNYDIRHTINISDRTLTLFHEPDEDE